MSLPANFDTNRSSGAPLRLRCSNLLSLRYTAFSFLFSPAPLPPPRPLSLPLLSPLPSSPSPSPSSPPLPLLPSSPSPPPSPPLPLHHPLPPLLAPPPPALLPSPPQQLRNSPGGISCTAQQVKPDYCYAVVEARPERWRVALSLLREVDEEGLGPDPPCISLVLSECARAGRWEVRCGRGGGGGDWEWRGDVGGEGRVLRVWGEGGEGRGQEGGWR